MLEELERVGQDPATAFPAVVSGLCEFIQTSQSANCCHPCGRQSAQHRRPRASPREDRRDLPPPSGVCSSCRPPCPPPTSSRWTSTARQHGGAMWAETMSVQTHLRTRTARRPPGHEDALQLCCHPTLPWAFPPVSQKYDPCLFTNDIQRGSERY